MAKTGRKPTYSKCEDMQKKIDAYFSSCEGQLITDDKGKPLFDKFGQPVYIDRHPPTIVGLALALGFTSRQTLLNYAEKPEFVDAITRAKARVEQYAEERLYDKDGTRGAQFTLRCNFGWKEDTDTDKSDPVNITIAPREKKDEPT